MSLEAPGDDKRCDHCDRPGVPYRYHGKRFSGLTSNKGEKLCPTCLDSSVKADLDAPVGWAGVPAREYITPNAYRYR